MINLFLTKLLLRMIRVSINIIILINRYNNKPPHYIILKTLCLELLKIKKKIKFQSGIFIKDSFYIESNNIFLNALGTNRYLKNFKSEEYGNEGYEIDKIINHFLKKKPNLFFDLGANFGEISIFFSKKYPNAKIFSVEASQENIKIFNKNLNAQNFPVCNITIINRAIFNKRAKVKFTNDLYAENSIVCDDIKNNKTNKTTYVRSSTLSDIINKYAKNRTIDFIKIDIEGSEPFLKNDLIQNSQKIKLMLIEFSNKNKKHKYYELLEQLGEYFLIYEKSLPLRNHLSFEKAKSIFRKRIEDSNGLDFIFFNKKFNR